MDWFNTIISALIGLLTACGGMMLYYRPKLKEALANAKKTEVEAESAEMDYLKKRLDSFEELFSEQSKILDDTRAKVLSMGREIHAKDERIAQLEAENKILSAKVDTLEKRIEAYKNRTNGGKADNDGHN